MTSRLEMEAAGASAEQVQLGIQGAEAVFERHQTTAQAVAEALAAREHDERWPMPPSTQATGPWLASSSGNAVGAGAILITAAVQRWQHKTREEAELGSNVIRLAPRMAKAS